MKDGGEILKLLFIVLFTSSLFVVNAFAVILSWTANTESDLAGYKIYYGTESGVYGDVLDVTLSTLPAMPSKVVDPTLMCGDSKTYFFAVTAYDTAENESKKSVEVSKEFDVAPCAPTITEIIAAVKELLRNARVESRIVFE